MQYEYDPFQKRAIEAIDAGKSVLVSAPTGAGKTAIAEYAIDQALARGERIVYTAPVKALSNQKFRDFSAKYPDTVGLLTGDVSLNPDSPIVIMTTEIYRILYEGKDVRAKDSMGRVYLGWWRPDLMDLPRSESTTESESEAA